MQKCGYAGNTSMAVIYGPMEYSGGGYVNLYDS